MIKQISYVLFLLLLVSCGGEGKKRVKKPDNLIPKDKMVNIIYDMSLLSAAKGINRKLMEKQGVHPEQYIYKKYDIDSLQFVQSNEYYAFDLKAYDDIYKQVKIKLNKEKKHYTEMVLLEKKQKDSLGKALRKERDSISKHRNLNDRTTKDIKILKSDNIKPKPLGRLKKIDSLKKLRNQ
jgi:hypothetical protein